MANYNYIKEWRKKHPNYHKEEGKKYYEKHKEEISKRRKENPELYFKRKKYYQKHKEERSEYNKKHKNERNQRDRELRLKVIRLLGGKCANPYGIDHSSFEGELDYIHCLQIDHINGGGSKEIKKIRPIGVCRKVLKNSKDYQLLCANCNWLKRWKNKEIS